jgi:hypothetical protein
LRCITTHNHGLPRKIALQFYGLGERQSKETGRVLQDGGKGKGRKLAGIRSTEGHDLLNEFLASLGGPNDLLHVLAQFWIAVPGDQGQGGTVRYDAKDIVEIMRYSTSEHAKGLHLIRGDGMIPLSLKLFQACSLLLAKIAQLACR